MQKKIKSIAVLSNLLNNFNNGIQCDKSWNVVHDEPFEVQREIYQFKAWNTHNRLRMSISQNVTKIVFIPIV